MMNRFYNDLGEELVVTIDDVTEDEIIEYAEDNDHKLARYFLARYLGCKNRNMDDGNAIDVLDDLLKLDNYIFRDMPIYKMHWHTMLYEYAREHFEDEIVRWKQDKVDAMKEDWE